MFLAVGCPLREKIWQSVLQAGQLPGVASFRVSSSMGEGWNALPSLPPEMWLNIAGTLAEQATSVDGLRYEDRIQLWTSSRNINRILRTEIEKAVETVVTEKDWLGSSAITIGHRMFWNFY